MMTDVPDLPDVETRCTLYWLGYTLTRAAVCAGMPRAVARQSLMESNGQDEDFVRGLDDALNERPGTPPLE